jgi:PhnB protein
MTSRAPRGYSSVSPYLMVENVEHELEFLRNVFGAEIIEEQPGEQGEIWHGEARVGDTVIMLTRAQKAPSGGQGAIYVWRENVDETYRRALESGGAGVSEPANQDYGTREATIRDPQGNTWWLGQELRKMPTKEIERRLMEQRKSRM